MGRSAGLLAGALLCALLCAAACGQSSNAPPPPRHVFVIVMENHSKAEALTGEYIAGLATSFGVAENYHAVAHPSVPNYLALTSGSTWGVTDDSYHLLPRQDIGTELSAAGLSWRAYMDGLTSAGCLNSPLPYDPGHNPFAFYGGRCPSNVVPIADLAPDLAGSTPRFVWIGPDRCHDTHDCPVTAGDGWLGGVVAQITSSAAWKSSGVLFITWDEDDGSAANNVLALVIASGVGHKVSTRAYTHYSLLATVEDLLGVARLGEAKQASPMNDLL